MFDIERALDNRCRVPIMAPDELPLHRQLRLKRIHDGFKIQELAEMLGLSVSTLSDYELGKRKISKKYLKRIEEYLYCELYLDKEFFAYIPLEEDDW